MPDDAHLLESVLMNWLGEVLGPVQLIHMAILHKDGKTVHATTKMVTQSPLTGREKWFSTIFHVSPSGSKHFTTGLDPGALT